MRTRALSLAVLIAALPGTACTRDGNVTAPLSKEEPAVRSARSFVHCVEEGTTACVRSGENIGGWDAFFLLTWLASGSPVSIIDALQRELTDHADPNLVQARFVDEVERYGNAIRGAECDPAAAYAIDPLIDKAAQTGAERLSNLGLWREDVSKVVEGLAEEAHEGLGGGYIVRLDCSYDPYRVYIATRRRGERFTVVGMTTMLPPFLGGDVPGRDVVTVRLHGRPLGLDEPPGPVQPGSVHRWLPFPVEVF